MIYFDIETVSTFNETVRNRKTPIKICEDDSEYLQKEKEKINYESDIYDNVKEKYWEKLNFMPEFNRILCISYWRYINWELEIKTTKWTEKEQIIEFFELISSKWFIVLCGFNIKGFDIPFLIKRAMKFKINIPTSINIAWKKPWEIKNMLDLQEVYKMNNFWSPWSLDLVCNFLWITSPKDFWINWSEVQEFFDNWKIDEIIEYCERDVLATQQVHKYFKEIKLL